MNDSEAFTIKWPLHGTYGSLSGSNDRISASFELMEALLRGSTLVDALTMVADRARLIAGAPLAFVALPGTEPNTLTVALAVGPDTDRVLGLTVRIGSSILGRVYSGRRALASRVPESRARTTPNSPDTGLPAGPILMLPLETGEATRGVLAIAGHPADLPLNASLQRQLTLFTSTSAALIELAEERRAATANRTL